MGKLVSEPRIEDALPNQISSEQFAEDILGFEEVDENEDGEEDELAEAGAGATYAGGDQSKLGVIAEEP